METSSNGVFIIGETFILIVFILTPFVYIGATISVIVRDATHGDGDIESLVQNVSSIILSGIGIPVIALYSMFMHKIFTGRFDQLDTSNATLIEGNATLVKKIEEGNSTLVKKIEEGNSTLVAGNAEIIDLLKKLIDISKNSSRVSQEEDFFFSRMDKRDYQRTFCNKLGSVKSAEEQQRVIDAAIHSGLAKGWVYGTAWEMGKFPPIHPKSR